ncbi:MAG TPA: amidohydrolase family protein, partial [Burkholderiaceae bacterium]|nr:amidohydrolase family protein [Burkholderiaceae bacterium]
EIDAVAARGAGVVICPSTEANLGDGLPDLPRWLAGGVPLAIGSDSQVGRDALEELRWLDYGQRLARRERNVAAAPGHETSTAARLVERVRSGGAAAAGFARWGFERGARADLLVADPGCDALHGLPPGALLDALVFASPVRPWRDVMVAGRWAIRAHEAPLQAAVAEAFGRAMRELWETEA